MPNAMIQAGRSAVPPTVPESNLDIPNITKQANLLLQSKIPEVRENAVEFTGVCNALCKQDNAFNKMMALVPEREKSTPAFTEAKKEFQEGQRELVKRGSNIFSALLRILVAHAKQKYPYLTEVGTQSIRLVSNVAASVHPDPLTPARQVVSHASTAKQSAPKGSEEHKFWKTVKAVARVMEYIAYAGAALLGGTLLITVIGGFLKK